jgi:DNA-binding response OmpR family regulator
MGARVLVVEDDTTLAAAIARDLRLQAHEVELAHDLAAAERVLSRGGIDVLLTDLSMHGGDGLELLRRSRALPAAPPAILMSGVASARDYQAAVDLGATRVLTKPFSSADLGRAVRQALECGQGYHGTIHGLALVDVLQAFHLCRRSVSIRVRGKREGVVHLCEGEIVHAVAGERAGEAALGWLIEQSGGMLATEGLDIDPSEHTIEAPFDHLLLEAVRTLDEQARGPDLAEGLRELGRKLIAGGEPLALPVAVGVVLAGGEVVALRGGAADDEWGAVAEEVVMLARRLTGAGRGVVERIRGANAMWCIWEEGIAVLLGDVVDRPGDAAWLRATTVAAVVAALEAARAVN